MTAMKPLASSAATCPRAVVMLATTTVLILAGCTAMTYDRIRLGRTQDECRQLLDQEVFRSCDIGYSGIQQDPAGRTNALVVLLGRDGLVGGKLQATLATPGGVPLGQPSATGAALSFQLRGELDLAALALQGAGPLDVLRAVLSELAGQQTVQSAGAARELVAAGLVRLLERWPQLNPASQFPELAETLERVPAHGDARLGVTPQGLFFLQYDGYATP
jgi:hypothetical protein